MKFAAISTGPQDMSVRQRCEALGVSEQGYYAYVDGTTTPAVRDVEDASLADAIARAHAVGRGTYGTPRLKTELAKHGACVSRRRIARIRDHLGLRVKCPRRFVHTTDSDHEFAIAPNLLERKFVASAPNTVWVSDITYLTSSDRWLYLCTIIDCYSGAIVGRQLSRAIDAKLVQDTLAMAIRNRKPAPGCMFHSDRGSQYASEDFRNDLSRHGFVQSMSRRANCWDNAVAESSFARLKSELGDTFTDDINASRQIYEYIDVFYNLTRIHSRHNMAPMTFETQSLKAA